MASNDAVYPWTFNQPFAPITAPPADETTVSQQGTTQTTTGRIGTIQTTTGHLGTAEYEVA